MNKNEREKEIDEELSDENDCLILTAKVDIHDLNDFLSHIRQIADALGTHIICLNAEMIAGREHAEMAIKLAARAFFRDENPISNSFEMEVLLYAGGTRQCVDAGLFGIHKGLNRLYICIYPKNNDAIEQLRTLVKFTENNNEHINEEKKRLIASWFSISNEELLAAGRDHIIDLVLERVALLDVNK